MEAEISSEQISGKNTVPIAEESCSEHRTYSKQWQTTREIVTRTMRIILQKTECKIDTS